MPWAEVPNLNTPSTLQCGARSGQARRGKYFLHRAPTRPPAGQRSTGRAPQGASAEPLMLYSYKICYIIYCRGRGRGRGWGKAFVTAPSGPGTQGFFLRTPSPMQGLHLWRRPGVHYPPDLQAHRQGPGHPHPANRRPAAGGVRRRRQPLPQASPVWLCNMQLHFGVGGANKPSNLCGLPPDG